MKPIVYHGISAAAASAAIQVTLLPRAAYSARDNPRLTSLGIALERQTGVHAIGSDRRTDFDTWMGTLARTPAGVDVFSESAVGGEYLVLRWCDEGGEGGEEDSAHRSSSRQQRVASPEAMQLALSLRRALIGGVTTSLEGLVQQLMLAVTEPSVGARADIARATLRPVYAQVLARIEDEIGAPGEDLSLAALGAMVQRSPLRFLREFKQLTGITPHAYVNERRLQRARAECLSANAPLSDVAAAAGYASQSHMGLAFRKMLRCSPAAYRRSLAFELVPRDVLDIPIS